MHRTHTLPICLLLALAALPALAFDVDRKTVEVTTIEKPSVAIGGLDFSALRAEIAFGSISIGEPVLRRTSTWCTPEQSRNKIRDAREWRTHYYEVPFTAEGGVLIVRDGAGRPVYTESLDAIDSDERFGYNQCAYIMPGPLEEDFRMRYGHFEMQLEKRVRESFVIRAKRAIDQALFFDVIDEKIPLYTYKDKLRDYSDLNRATELALRGYGTRNEEDVRAAVAIWEAALEEADLGDRNARIHRKVARRLYESLGMAWLTLGDAKAAVELLERAAGMSSMTTSRGNGTGTSDLLQRARQRKVRARRNADLPTDPAEIDELIARTSRYKGRIPVLVQRSTALAALRLEHQTFVSKAIFADVDAERADREEAVASGRVNPFERQMGHTASQGFYLFLMPYGQKFEEFPAEVTGLTQLNRLRVQGHGFETLPESIGRLEALEVLNLSGNALIALPESIGDLRSLRRLDLSGNNLQTLPESIGRLKSLKSLTLKGNPLAAGELERLERLLPGCKIKG